MAVGIRFKIQCPHDAIWGYLEWKLLDAHGFARHSLKVQRHPSNDYYLRQVIKAFKELRSKLSTKVYKEPKPEPSGKMTMFCFFGNCALINFR